MSDTGIIKKYKETADIINELEDISDFLGNLSESFLGKGVINNVILDCSLLATSLKCTLGSIIDCAVKYYIADAMTLLRKFKDDLWFILYIFKYIDKRAEYNKSDSITQKINDWVFNKLRNLYAVEVIKEIFNTDGLDELNKKYKIEESLKEMAAKLDNFVHSNGIDFYNRPIIVIDNKVIDNLSWIKETVIKNLIFFIVIIAINFPFYLSSSDYENCLDIGQAPPLNAQYLVAPYIEEFLKKYAGYVDSNIKSFLKEKSFMDFSDI